MNLRIANIYFLLSLIIVTLVISQLFSIGNLLEGLDSKIQYLPDEFIPTEYTNFNTRYRDG